MKIIGHIDFKDLESKLLDRLKKYEGILVNDIVLEAINGEAKQELEWYLKEHDLEEAKDSITLKVITITYDGKCNLKVMIGTTTRFTLCQN